MLPQGANDIIQLIAAAGMTGCRAFTVALLASKAYTFPVIHFLYLQLYTPVVDFICDLELPLVTLAHYSNAGMISDT